MHTDNGTSRWPPPSHRVSGQRAWRKQMARNIHRSCAAALWALAMVAPGSAQNEQFIPGLVYRTGAYAVSGAPYANGLVYYCWGVNGEHGGINGLSIGL